MTARIYLHHHCGAPLRPQAADAIARAATTAGNPSSLHAIGRLARRELDLAATIIKNFVKAPKADVVFTGSATEANDLAIMGLARQRKRQRILIGDDESPSAMRAVECLTRQGFVRQPLSDATLADDVALIVLGLEAWSTGRTQDTVAVAKAAEHYGIPMHIDASRAASVTPIDLVGSGATTLTLASETLGGPRGAGALVKLKGLELTPLWHGGGQEGGARSGSQAVLLIAGFAAAVEQARHIAHHDLDVIWSGQTPVGGPRLANISTIELPPNEADALVKLASDRGVMLGRVPRGVCATAGWSTTEEDVRAAALALASCAPDLQKAS